MLSTREFHFFGPRLRAIGVTSVDHNLCDQEYEPFGGLTERMFCVHTNTPTESLCNVRIFLVYCIDQLFANLNLILKGDGGAPLVVSHTLVGFISHGLGCLWTGVPTVATNVAYFNSWIKSTTGI
jgi:secreted trypsin-like serine protease